MVATVKLAGLNIRLSRGKWYVSLRSTGDSLVKGFVGSRAALDKHLGSPAVLKAYTTAKTRDRRPVYADGTLGALVARFKEESPRWAKLSDASRKDYEKTFLYLDPEFDTPLSGIVQADIDDVRDKASRQKWPRFADKMVSHLSVLFKFGVKKRMMMINPAAGVEKIHAADPNANHEWRRDEVMVALALAPRHVLTPLLLARFQGWRGQTIQALRWNVYVADQKTGRAFDLTLRKNNEMAWFPCEPETRAHLDALPRAALSICTNSEGRPWKNETVMQGAVSDYLTVLKDEGLIREGCTLHGLRVTYAAAIRRMDLDTGTVADALGDRSKRMGEHYTRHVEKEVSRLRAWRRKNEQ